MVSKLVVGGAFGAALLAAGCASTGNNHLYSIVDKNHLIETYDLGHVTKRTAECYTPAMARVIAREYCTLATQGVAPLQYRNKVGDSKDDLKPDTEDTAAMQACLADVYKPDKSKGVRLDEGPKEAGFAVGRLLDEFARKHPQAPADGTALGYDAVRHGIRENCATKPERWRRELAPVYWNRDLPYVATDSYDTREARYRKVEVGKPLNVIVNKVWLFDSDDNLHGGNGEIAVVLSVDDGTEQGGKDVLVAYADAIGDSTALPIADLLAYSTDRYLGQPIRISLTLFEFDQVENNEFQQILETGAASVAAAAPAAATIGSLAQSLGSYLLKHNADDKLLQFTFQLYPWSDISDSVPNNVGVPRVARGSYLVVNWNDTPPEKAGERVDIQFDYDLKPFKVEPKGHELPLAGMTQACRAVGWSPPNLFECGFSQERSAADAPKPLAASYMLFTVDDTPLVNANSIIARADTVLREAVKAGQSAEVSAAKLSDLRVLAQGLVVGIDVLKQRERLKRFGPKAPAVVTEVMEQLSGSPETEESLALEEQVRSILPEDLSESCDSIDQDCIALWKEVVDQAEYDKKEHRFEVSGRLVDATRAQIEGKAAKERR